jgi:DNA/RNA endonuclease YhcR with UshA esterase domain
MLSGLINLTTKVTGTLPVGNGGTGSSSLTANRLMIGNGTGAITVLASGTTGQVLMSNGSSAPTFADIDGGSF